MTLSVCFTNFGPYHLARLRALARRLAESGDRLIAYEVADEEMRYPWARSREAEPFAWNTLFPGRALETIGRDDWRPRHGPGPRPRPARRPGDRRLLPAGVDGRTPMGDPEPSADHS